MQTVQASGITLARCIQQTLYVARGSLLEVYEVLGPALRFVQSHKFVNRVLFVDTFKQNLLIGTAQQLLVVSPSLEQITSYEAVPASERLSDAEAQFCYCKSSETVIALSQQNTLTFIHLGMGISQSVAYRSGKILSIAAYGDLFAVLAQTSYLDPGLVLTNYKNLRACYLAIFSTHGSCITELQKLTQLPFDSYKVIEAPSGFFVMAPRQFIYKRFKQTDIRIRFSYLCEEADADQEEVKKYLAALNENIDFDFSNLLKNKVYTMMNDNIVKENEIIQTVNQLNIPRAPLECIPGSPALSFINEFKYYGFNTEEINMKQCQVTNCIGDFPVFDFTLEAELFNKNKKYVGPKCNLHNFCETAPIYNAQCQFLDQDTALICNSYGLMFSLIFDDIIGVKLIPALMADPNQALWNESIVNSMAFLSQTTTPDAFTSGQNRQTYLVFLGSSIGDSYIAQVQISSSVPQSGYYIDYRQQHDAQNTDFRQQLYQELKNSCGIINIKKQKEEEIVVEQEQQTVDFAGVKLTYSQQQFQSLFKKNLKPFEPSKILEMNMATTVDMYENTPHFAIKFVGVLPSLAGVVDGVVTQIKKHQSVQNSVNLLHYSGCIQKIQQQVSVDSAQVFDKSFSEQLSAIHVIETYDKDKVAFLMVVKKSTSEVIRVSQKNGKIEFSDKNELSDLNTNRYVLLMQKYEGDLVQVTEREIKIYQNFKKNPACYSFKDINKDRNIDKESDTIAINASISQDGILVVVFDSYIGIYVLKNSKLEQKKFVFPFLYCHLDKQTIITSAEICQSQSLLNYLDCPDRYSHIVSVVLSESQVLLFGIKNNYQADLISYFSGFAKQNNIADESQKQSSLYFQSEIDIEIVDDSQQIHLHNVPKMSDIGKEMYPLFFSQVHFKSVSVYGSQVENVFMFASVKGGGSFVYQLIKQQSRVYFKQIQNLTNSLQQTKILEDRFAFCIREGKEDHRILQTKPFVDFEQDGLNCIFMGYSPPSMQTEPCSYVAVPTLQGALSFYQLGRQPSRVKIETGDQTQLASLLQTCFPIRAMVPLSFGCIALADCNQLIQKEYKPLAPKTAYIHYFKQINFGNVKSSMDGIPLNKTLATFGISDLSYLASLSQNAINVHRQLLMLPFCCSKFTYHTKTNNFVVVSSMQRYEIRQAHSITKDEVANIRIFETVDQYEDKMDENDLIQFCHRLLLRDPAPINSQSVMTHEHMFLVDFNGNRILDHQPIELMRTEHVNSIVSDQIYSKYPQNFGKYWHGSFKPMDQFGRVDRRRKNDDREKRLENLQQYNPVEEYRELIFIGTGYIMGGFNKQYGKISILTVEHVDEKYKEIENIQRDVDKITENNSRIASGQIYALNRVTQEEIQNAATAIICQPKSKCVMIAEAKQINAYYLTDGQKLEKCEMMMGYGYINQMVRFQDFILICDGYHDSKLLVFRDKGKRLTEFSGIPQECIPVACDFMINSFNDELFQVFGFKNQVGIFGYKYDTDNVLKKERMQLQQIIPCPETTVKILKIPTSITEPCDLTSSLADLIITAEGGIIQLIPVAQEILELIGYNTCALKGKKLNFFDIEQRQGVYLIDEWPKNFFTEQIVWKGKILQIKGAF